MTYISSLLRVFQGFDVPTNKAENFIAYCPCPEFLVQI